jgi:hypothetical protein
MEPMLHVVISEIREVSLFILFLKLVVSRRLIPLPVSIQNGLKQGEALRQCFSTLL